MTSTDELERLRQIWLTSEDEDDAFAFADACGNALPGLLEKMKRLESALHEVIGLDHHNMGPESSATKLARAALTQEPGE